jgi:hypothetical protein
LIHRRQQAARQRRLLQRLRLLLLWLLRLLRLLWLLRLLRLLRRSELLCVSIQLPLQLQASLHGECHLRSDGIRRGRLQLRHRVNRIDGAATVGGTARLQRARIEQRSRPGTDDMWAGSVAGATRAQLRTRAVLTEFAPRTVKAASSADDATPTRLDPGPKAADCRWTADTGGATRARQLATPGYSTYWACLPRVLADESLLCARRRPDPPAIVVLVVDLCPALLGRGDGGDLILIKERGEVRPLEQRVSHAHGEGGPAHQRLHARRAAVSVQLVEQGSSKRRAERVGQYSPAERGPHLERPSRRFCVGVPLELR